MFWHKKEKFEVACPKCQLMIPFDKGAQSIVCPNQNCRHSFNPTAVYEGEAVVKGTSGDKLDIRCGCEDSQQVVWKHPLDKFPIGAMLVAAPGMAAVCVQGNECKLIVDGESKELNQSALADNAFSVDGGEARVYMSVYYVRKQLDMRVTWGGRATVTTDNEAVAMAFPMRGESVVKEIANPFRFLQWIGFAEINRSELEEAADQIHPMLCNAMGVALYDVMREYGYSAQALPAHKDDVVRDLFQVQANERLAETGLKVTNTRIDGIDQPVMEVVDVLQYRVERAFNWQTGSVRVNVKDEPALYADLIIGVSGQLRIADLRRMNTSDKTRWTMAGTGDDVVVQDIGADISKTLTSLMPQILQGMINNVNAPISELPQFLGYIGTTVTNYLNSDVGPLYNRGLRVEGISAEIRRTEKSLALQEKEKLGETVATTNIAEEMRRYAQGIELTRAQETSAHELRMRGVKETLADDQLARDKRANQRAEEYKDMDAQSVIKDIGRKAQIEAAQHQAQQIAQQRQSNEMYEEWKRQTRLDEEKLEAQIRQERMKQAAGFDTEKARLAHQEEIRKVIHEIEQSDLDWKEKLDAYARLKRQQDLNDTLTETKSKAAAEADVLIAQERAKLQVSQETAALMQEAARQEAARKEEAQQMQFAREMEMRRIALAEEIERFNLHQAEVKRADEAQERARMQQTELEKTKLMLNYALEKNGQALDQARLERETAELKCKAEEEYNRRHEVEEKERREREAADQRRREETTMARAEELVREMMEVQKSLDTLRLDNERAYQYGRACVDQTRAAQMSEQHVNEIKEELDRLQNKLSKTKSSLETKIDESARNSYMTVPVGNAQQFVCKYCGNHNPPYSSMCIKCQRPL